MVSKWQIEAYANETIFCLTITKANIFLGLMEYELNSLRVASHQVHFKKDLPQEHLN